MKKFLTFTFITFSLIASESYAVLLLPVAEHFRLKELPGVNEEQTQQSLSELKILNQKMEQGLLQYNNAITRNKVLGYGAKMAITFGEASLPIPDTFPMIKGSVAVAAENARLMSEKLIQISNDNYDKSFQNLAEHYLAVFLKNTSKAELDDILTEFKTDKTKALQRLSDTTGLLNSAEYNKMDDRRKMAFQKTAVEKIAHDIAIQEIVTKAKIEDLETNLNIADQKATSAIALNILVYGATMSKMDDLMSATEDVHSTLINFKKKTDEYHEKNMDAHESSHGFLDRMEDYEFKKMSPEDQLSALENGWRPDLKGAQRNALKGKLELKAKIRATNQKITTNLTEMTESFEKIAAIGKIANDLKVNPKVVKVISDAASLGGTALKVANSLLTNRPLAAVAAVTGLFGKKTDIGAERHKQVMAAFGKVFENQKNMLNRLDKLKNNQIKMMENQVRIFESISALSKQSSMQYLSLGNQVQDLKKMIYQTQEVGMSTNTQGIKSCSTFLPKSYTDGNVIPLNKMSYSQFSDHIRGYGTTFNNCMSGLDQMLPSLSSLDKLEPYFKLANYSFENDSGVERYIKYVYNPIIDYHKQNVDDESHELQDSLRQLSSPINVSVVVKLAETLSAIHPYFQVLDDPASPGNALHNPQAISLVDLQSKGPVNRIKGRDHMQALVKIIDAAILQQKMVSGVGVFKLIEHDLLSDNQQRRLRAGQALVNNPLLQKNIVVSAIQHKLESENINRDSYANIHNRYNEAVVIQDLLIGPRWRVSQDEKNKKWKVTLDLIFKTDMNQDEYQKKSVEVYFPDPAQILNEELNYQPELQSLLKMKNLLVNEIIQYDLWDDSHDWFKKLYLKTN